jgi:hypothetical protein
MLDLTEIAYEAVRPMTGMVDEIARDYPDDLEYKNRTILIVSEGDVSQPRETDLTRTGYWISTVEVAVIGPDKRRCQQICLDAFQLVIEEFHAQTLNGVGPILGLARGEKEIGVAAFGGILIGGYCARRILEVHNTIE